MSDHARHQPHSTERARPAAHFAQLFANRADAGARLAEELRSYASEHPLVLGIPRGGVEVGVHVATRLAAELDVIVARKLPAPDQTELAIGAITADGTRVLNHELIALLGVSPAYLSEVTRAEWREAQRREQMFRVASPALAVAGRVVILVDDGLATGATVRVCIQSLERANVQKIVVAAPVGAVDTCAAIAAEVERVVCLAQPEPFHAVAAHYLSFEQLGEATCVRLLSEFGARNRPQGSA